MSALLVEVWRFQSVGREEDARRLLADVWAWGMDAFATDRDARVALRLLRRLRPVASAPADFEALPDSLVVYRAGNLPGLCWTRDREVAEMHARRHGLRLH